MEASTRNLNAEALLDDLWRLTPCRVAERLSRGKFVRFPHIQFISRKIAQSVAAGNARLIISMPPRHGKSWLTSLWTPVWYLGLNPEKSIIFSSYEADFAASWGRQVRNVIQEHGSLLGVKLMDDSQASDRWNTTQGGRMVTAGIGGPITGRGGHLILIDDPVKNWEQATSDLQRQKAIDWFNSTLYTRAEPGASIILLMTRWHERDLAGYLEAEHADDWTVMRIPALAEEGDILGREIGAPLCPERYDLVTLEKRKNAVGSRMWNALYQQRPSPAEGGLIKRSWFRFWKTLPDRFDQIIQSWDLAFKDSKNSDFVVGQVWGRKGADKFLIDQIRARMDFPTTIQAIKNLSARYPHAMTKIVEEKANGAAVIATLKRELAGLIPFRPDTSKEARVNAVSPQIESGNVFLPDPSIYPWVEGLVEEAVSFPTAAHDDQVDAMSQALLRFADSSIYRLEDLLRW